MYGSLLIVRAVSVLEDDLPQFLKQNFLPGSICWIVGVASLESLVQATVLVFLVLRFLGSEVFQERFGVGKVSLCRI
jgi:hypothetical protein